MPPLPHRRLLLATAALLPSAAFALRQGRQLASTDATANAAHGFAGGSASGTRCTGAAPALLRQSTTTRGGRAAEILQELWACRLPAGVRAVGGDVQTEVPDALRDAVAIGPDAAKGVLTAAPAENLPIDTINWASGGLDVAMPENQTLAFLTSVFDHIAAAGLSIDIRQQDLFHGHVFGLPPAAGGAGELGIFFHAKEYPEDLTPLDPKGASSGFTTQSPGYADRNLLYLTSLNRIFVVDPLDASNSNYLLLSNLEIAQWLPDWAQPEVIRTVSEEAFLEVSVGRMLDVNLLPRVLEKPDGGLALFTKAF